MKKNVERKNFEKWITSPPYEKSIKQHRPNGSWPNQYVEYDVQIAWEAWMERAAMIGVRIDQAGRVIDAHAMPIRPEDWAR